jgi:UDP-glucose 6-dehydrogenase
MKLTIVCSGYEGLVIGVCLEEQSNNVFCDNVDPMNIVILNSGGSI